MPVFQLKMRRISVYNLFDFFRIAKIKGASVSIGKLRITSQAIGITRSSRGKMKLHRFPNLHHDINMDLRYSRETKATETTR